MSADKVLQLKEQLNKLKSEKSRKEGMLASIDERLKDQFGVLSPAEGYNLLNDLETKGTQLKTKLESLIQEIETNYGDQLNAVGR